VQSNRCNSLIRKVRKTNSLAWYRYRNIKLTNVARCQKPCWTCRHWMPLVTNQCKVCVAVYIQFLLLWKYTKLGQLEYWFQLKFARLACTLVQCLPCLMKDQVWSENSLSIYDLFSYYF
jgi:hypothetical protein